MSPGKSEKRWKRRPESRPAASNVSRLALLVLFSGFASLVYQVLWMRQLGLLFGNGSQAAAVTFAVFFAGLGAGSWWWGRRIAKRPLRAYAGLELGIALTALLYFPLLAGFHAAYGWLHGFHESALWRMTVNGSLALCLIFPPAFFMGGTVPAMAQAAVRERDRFGPVSALLYGINTLGAACGVVLAAFFLLPSFGMRLSYTLAVLMSLGVAALSWRWARGEADPPAMEETPQEPGQEAHKDGLPGVFAVLAFVSGFVVLGLEVVWTRVFAQVHENSVYSFAMILALVLTGLAIGAGISSLIARFSRRPMPVLAVLMLVAGGLLVIGPLLIMRVTHQLQPVHTNEAWGAYLGNLLRMGFGGIGFSVIALGTVFPFLMKVVEERVQRPARMLGHLLAWNTLGAIAGSLVAGFLMLPLLGMWGSLRLLTLVQLQAVWLVPLAWKRPDLVLRGAAVALMVLLFTLLNPTRLPVMGQVPGKQPHEVLEVWEGSDCTVAAVRTRAGLAIMINGSYSLGSTAARVEQENQSVIPLHLYPDTRSICYIGVGTGMSVNGALDRERFPTVERVVACELSPSVIEAAKRWMTPLGNSLFEDPRCEIRLEDGRHHLMVTRERYDMINADLFLPYRRGTGSLYSLDYYEIVAERLNPDGVFVQWLPLYQLTEFEFGVIANTMLQVFDEVSLWRNNFSPGHEKVALIARLKRDPVVVPPTPDYGQMRSAVDNFAWQHAVPENAMVDAESMPFFYGGNLGLARELFAEYPINSDDRPIIEFQTPWRFREVAQKDKVIWCVGPKLLRWMDRLFEMTPPGKDPLFKGHPPNSAHLVRSGLAFHKTMVAKFLEGPHVTDRHWTEFKEEWIRAATPGEQ